MRGTMLQLLDLGLTESEAIEWLYEENDVLGEKPIAALVKGHKAPVRRAAQALG
ncbi:MAG: Rv2175c family DNA-binding protein [Aquiluna sp.]